MQQKVSGGGVLHALGHVPVNTLGCLSPLTGVGQLPKVGLCSSTPWLVAAGALLFGRSFLDRGFQGLDG